MKKRVAIALTAICMAVVCLTGCQAVTKDYGGEMTHSFQQQTDLGVFEGTVTIVESKE